MKLLVKNPAERYPTTGDLKKDLQRYREGGHQLSAGYRPAEAQPVVPPPTQKAPEEPPQPKPQAAPPAQGVGPPPPVTVLEPSSRVGLYTAAAVIFVAVVLLVVFVLVTVLGNGGNDGNGSVSVSTGEPEEPDDPDELPPDGDTGGGSGPVPNGESVPTGVLVAVPGVVDQSVDDAVRFLRDRGFASELRVESGSVGPAGQVLRQDPSAGSEVASGSLVVLYLAEGPRAVEVPDVVGMTLLRATQVLVQAGLVVSEEVVEEFSVDVERGLVIGTVPAPPALLPPDSSIIILVSSGSENVVVPNLVGLTSVVAAQRLSEIQLVLVQPVGECDFPNSTEDLAGRIMDQTPSAGEEHSQGYGSDGLFGAGSFSSRWFRFAPAGGAQRGSRDYPKSYCCWSRTGCFGQHRELECPVGQVRIGVQEFGCDLFRSRRPCSGVESGESVPDACRRGQFHQLGGGSRWRHTGGGRRVRCNQGAMNRDSC